MRTCSEGQRFYFLLLKEGKNNCNEPEVCKPGVWYKDNKQIPDGLSSVLSLLVVTRVACGHRAFHRGLSVL